MTGKTNTTIRFQTSGKSTGLEDEQKGILASVPYREQQSWQDLVVNETVYTEHQVKAENMIVRNLGYLPGKDVSIRHMPFLRTCLHLYLSKLMDPEEFFLESRFLMKCIRNLDIASFMEPSYPRGLLDLYHRRPETQRQFVRNRLSYFLGYAPDLEHSVMAELWMQDVVEKGMIAFNERSNCVDHRAMTIILCRQILLQYGKEVADNSDLWYFDYADQQGRINGGSS